MSQFGQPSRFDLLAAWRRPASPESTRYFPKLLRSIRYSSMRAVLPRKPKPNDSCGVSFMKWPLRGSWWAENGTLGIGPNLRAIGSNNGLLVLEVLNCSQFDSLAYHGTTGCWARNGAVRLFPTRVVRSGPTLE